MRLSLAAAAVVFATSTASAQSLLPMLTFGGGDGWRAPNEIVAGDSAGSNSFNTSQYNYLTNITANQTERGLAYNSVTGNLILVSRNNNGANTGTNVRVLSGSTGADLRGLSVAGITGGTFTVSMAGVAGDGKVYVSNLTTTATVPHKVYQWADDSGAAAPSVFSSTLYPLGTFTTSTGGTTTIARLGDSFDVTGLGTTTTLAAGVSGNVGYAIITTPDGLTGTGTAVTAANAPPPNSGLSHGITFASTKDEVWGRVVGATTTYRTSYLGSALTSSGTMALTTTTESGMDYATIAGTPYLATIDTGSSAVGAAGAGVVRVYDVTTPASPLLVASLNNTTGTLVTNSNRGSQVAWGAIDNLTGTATLYTISANQGVQAFIFSAVPEPGLVGLAAAGIFILARRLPRKI